MCGLGLTWLVSTPSASRPATQLPRVRTRIEAAGAFDFAPVLALCPNWEEELLAPSMARSTADAFNIACCLDNDGKFDDAG